MFFLRKGQLGEKRRGTDICLPGPSWSSSEALLKKTGFPQILQCSG